MSIISDFFTYIQINVYLIKTNPGNNGFSAWECQPCDINRPVLEVITLGPGPQLERQASRSLLLPCSFLQGKHAFLKLRCLLSHHHIKQQCFRVSMDALTFYQADCSVENQPPLEYETPEPTVKTKGLIKQPSLFVIEMLITWTLFPQMSPRIYRQKNPVCILNCVRLIFMCVQLSDFGFHVYKLRNIL